MQVRFEFDKDKFQVGIIIFGSEFPIPRWRCELEQFQGL
jgi:hypothetical protein